MGYHYGMLYHGSAHKLGTIQPSTLYDHNHNAGGPKVWASSKPTQARYYARQKPGHPSSPNSSSRSRWKHMPQSRTQGYLHHIPETGFEHRGGSYYSSDHAVKPVKVERVKYSRKQYPVSRNEVKGAVAVVGAGAALYGGYRLHKHFQQRKQADRMHTHAVGRAH